MASPTTGLTATTDRQKQIKKLLGEGKNPQQIAKKLGISDNAVHQQVRRMRQHSGGAASTSGGSTKRAQSRTAKKAPSAGRKSTRTRSAASRPAPRPATPATAEELIRAEIVAAEESKGEKSALIESLKGQIAEAEAGVLAHDAEIERKRDVLAVMTGEKVAHAKPAPPKPKAKSKPKANSGAKANGTAQTTGGKDEGTDGSQEPPQGAQAADSSAPDPDAPQSQAEREATADHDGPTPAPAEASQEAAAATA